MEPVPALAWARVGDRYEATDADGTLWSIEQHAPTLERAGTPPNWTPRWQYSHQTCPLVTRARWTALHRHPEVLRYADVLDAGWTPSHREADALLMRRGEDTAPLPDLTRTPATADH